MVKTNLDAVYKTDEKKTESGVWVEDIGLPGIDFKLKRTSNNPQYSEMSRRLLRPYRRQIANGKLDVEIQNKISNKVLAHTVIVDWKGIKDENGEDIPFTAKNAIDLLTAYPDLADDIMTAASDIGNFLVDTDDEEKNSVSA